MDNSTHFCGMVQMVEQGPKPKSPNMCKVISCERNVFVDPTTGIRHDFCGRTHARQYAESHGQMLPPPHGSCHQCQLPNCSEQVSFDEVTQRVHDYCCFDHSRRAMAMGIQPPSNMTLQGQGRLYHRCSLFGCSAPRFVDPTSNKEHDYCGRSHARQAAMQGLLPAAQDYSQALVPNPESVSRIWRGNLNTEEYTISEMQNLHPKKESVKAQFLQAWEHPGHKPSVQRVYSITNSAPIYQQYTDYGALFPAKNEERRFHGTGSAVNCCFGINALQPPCSDTACAVCNIAANSFDMKYAGSGPAGRTVPGVWAGGLRYGRGLYFSKTASKSHDYVEKTGSVRTFPDGSKWGVMFLCKIVLGANFRTESTSLEQAVIDDLVPSRFSSVTGLTKQEGGGLNYEENVVYTGRAAIPSYLIVYKL